MVSVKSAMVPEQAHSEGYSMAGAVSAHVAAAATVGGALATIVEWGIEVAFHVTTPTQVDDAIAAICIFSVSLLMRKLIG